MEHDEVQDMIYSINWMKPVLLLKKWYMFGGIELQLLYSAWDWLDVLVTEKHCGKL